MCLCMCVQLDNAAFMLDKSYKLVVSTPGAKDVLTRDREFVAFKGFPILGTGRVYVHIHIH
jgi:ribosome maturation factor RimP